MPSLVATTSALGRKTYVRTQMDFKLNLKNIPLPKDLHFHTAIWFLHKANNSMVYEKTEILVKF